MRYIALLRAINVGGHTVTMARLRALCAGVGLRDVTTFIASGNVRFESRASNVGLLERRIERHLETALGFEVATLIRTPAEMQAAAHFDPFGTAPVCDMPVSDFVGFLKAEPEAGAIARLLALANAVDAFHVRGRECYWRRTGPNDASRFSGNALERVLGQSATLRNVTTVRKLALLAG